MDHHVRMEVLAEYFDGLTSPQQTRFIEGHLAECNSCADCAQQVFAFSAVLDQWTAKRAKNAKDLKNAIETATRAAQEREIAIAS